MGFWEILILIAVFTKYWSPVKGFFVWVGGYVFVGILLLILFFAAYKMNEKERIRTKHTQDSISQLETYLEKRKNDSSAILERFEELYKDSVFTFYEYDLSEILFSTRRCEYKIENDTLFFYDSAHNVKEKFPIKKINHRYSKINISAVNRGNVFDYRPFERYRFIVVVCAKNGDRINYFPTDDDTFRKEHVTKNDPLGLFKIK